MREGDRYYILEVDDNAPQIRRHMREHNYVIGDAHDDIFAEATFDVITLFEVLEHTRDPFRVLANCARWLRPGGRILVSSPQYWHVHGYPHDYFRFTVGGLRELARRSALEVVDLWAMGGPFMLLWCVIELNFGLHRRMPLLNQLVGVPATLVARAGDAVLFRHNEQRSNPDTKGWMAVLRKP